MAASFVEGDLYALLHLRHDASDKEIQTAYRKLSRTVHPDTYKGHDTKAATENFLKLTQAKEILLDRTSRRLLYHRPQTHEEAAIVGAVHQ